MITLYIGKSAVGKDTLLKKQIEDGVSPIISFTTRPMREGEVNGVDYNFVSTEEFNRLFENGDIAEKRSCDTLVDGKPDTWYYGSPRLTLDRLWVGVVTVDGAMSYIDLYGKDEVNVIYVTADYEVRHERAMKRGSFNEQEWNRRVIADEKDFSEENIEALERKLGKPVERLDNNEDFEKKKPISEYTEDDFRDWECFER